MYNKGEGEVKPVIAYGASVFACGGRGEMSVPVKYVKQKCQTYYTTHLVDEFRTSIVCPFCDELLQKVVKKVDENKIREVRGLRRCCSTACAQFSFKSRDLIGAINILRCFVNKERPLSLTRKAKAGKVNLKSYLLRPKPKHKKSC